MQGTTGADPVAAILKPYEFHGLELTPDSARKEARGECPICHKHKFYVNLHTGKWDCKTCPMSGNTAGFIDMLWRHSHQHTPVEDYKELAEARGLSVGTRSSWGVCRSHTTGEWLVPGHNHTGAPVQFYRYV